MVGWLCEDGQSYESTLVAIILDCGGLPGRSNFFAIERVFGSLRRLKLFVLVLPLIGFALVFVDSLNLLGFDGQMLYYRPPAEIQEVKGERTIGQTFVAPLPGLHRIDVMLFDRGHRNTHDVTFRLREGITSSTDILSITFNASEVAGARWYRFDFPPLVDSAGKTYYFYFSSPESTDGNAIAVGGVQLDLYPDGMAYLNTTPANADLAFKTYYAAVAPAQKVEQLLERLAENKPFFWGNKYFYVFLVVVYLLLVTLFIWQSIGGV